MSIYDKLVGATADGLLPPAVLDGVGDFMASRTPSASGATVTHYVSPTGDDATGDGTEANPFRTIAHAVSLIPDVVRDEYNIYLLPGEYDENVSVARKTIQSVFRLGGATNDRSLYRVRKVIFDRVQGQAYMQNMVSTVDVENERSFEFRGSGPMMFAQNLECTPDNGGPFDQTRGLLADYGSIVSVSNCDFSGKRYGVRSNNRSQTYLTSSNTGTGNQVGIAARWGAFLGVNYGTLPTGDTPMSTNSGGIISVGHGAIVGNLDEVALLATENYRDWGVTSKTWLMTRETIPSTWIPDADIPSDSTIRFRFRAPADNVQYKVSVDWLARVHLTGAQSAETRSALFMRGNAFTLNDTSVLQSNGMGASPVVVSARGQLLDFYIDIVGARAMRGEWSARIKIDSSLGKLPILAQAEIL